MRGWSGDDGTPAKATGPPPKAKGEAVPPPDTTTISGSTPKNQATLQGATSKPSGEIFAKALAALPPPTASKVPTRKCDHHDTCGQYVTEARVAAGGTLCKNCQTEADCKAEPAKAAGEDAATGPAEPAAEPMMITCPNCSAQFEETPGGNDWWCKDCHKQKRCPDDSVLKARLEARRCENGHSAAPASSPLPDAFNGWNAVDLTQGISTLVEQRVPTPRDSSSGEESDSAVVTTQWPNGHESTHVVPMATAKPFTLTDDEQQILTVKLLECLESCKGASNLNQLKALASWNSKQTGISLRAYLKKHPETFQIFKDGKVKIVNTPVASAAASAAASHTEGPQGPAQAGESTSAMDVDQCPEPEPAAEPRTEASMLATRWQANLGATAAEPDHEVSPMVMCSQCQGKCEQAVAIGECPSCRAPEPQWVPLGNASAPASFSCQSAPTKPAEAAPVSDAAVAPSPSAEEEDYTLAQALQAQMVLDMATAEHETGSEKPSKKKEKDATPPKDSAPTTLEEPEAEEAVDADKPSATSGPESASPAAQASASPAAPPASAARPVLQLNLQLRDKKDGPPPPAKAAAPDRRPDDYARCDKCGQEYLAAELQLDATMGPGKYCPQCKMHVDLSGDEDDLPPFPIQNEAPESAAVSQDDPVKSPVSDEEMGLEGADTDHNEAVYSVPNMHTAFHNPEPYDPPHGHLLTQHGIRLETLQGGQLSDTIMTDFPDDPDADENQTTALGWLLATAIKQLPEITLSKKETKQVVETLLGLTKVKENKATVRNLVYLRDNPSALAPVVQRARNISKQPPGQRELEKLKQPPHTTKKEEKETAEDSAPPAAQPSSTPASASSDPRPSTSLPPAVATALAPPPDPVTKANAPTAAPLAKAEAAASADATPKAKPPAKPVPDVPMTTGSIARVTPPGLWEKGTTLSALLPPRPGAAREPDKPLGTQEGQKQAYHRFTDRWVAYKADQEPGFDLALIDQMLKDNQFLHDQLDIWLPHFDKLFGSYNKLAMDEAKKGLVLDAQARVSSGLAHALQPATVDSHPSLRKRDRLMQDLAECEKWYDEELQGGRDKTKYHTLQDPKNKYKWAAAKEVRGMRKAVTTGLSNEMARCKVDKKLLPSFHKMIEDSHTEPQLFEILKQFYPAMNTSNWLQQYGLQPEENAQIHSTVCWAGCYVFYVLLRTWAAQDPNLDVPVIEGHSSTKLQSLPSTPRDPIEEKKRLSWRQRECTKHMQKALELRQNRAMSWTDLREQVKYVESGLGRRHGYDTWGQPVDERWDVREADEKEMWLAMLASRNLFSIILIDPNSDEMKLVDDSFRPEYTTVFHNSRTLASMTVSLFSSGDTALADDETPRTINKRRRASSSTQAKALAKPKAKAKSSGMQLPMAFAAGSAAGAAITVISATTAAAATGLPIHHPVGFVPWHFEVLDCTKAQLGLYWNLEEVFHAIREALRIHPAAKERHDFVHAKHKNWVNFTRKQNVNHGWDQASATGPVKYTSIMDLLESCDELLHNENGVITRGGPAFPEFPFYLMSIGVIAFLDWWAYESSRHGRNIPYLECDLKRLVANLNEPDPSKRYGYGAKAAGWDFDGIGPLYVRTFLFTCGKNPAQATLDQATASWHRKFLMIPPVSDNLVGEQTKQIAEQQKRRLQQIEQQLREDHGPAPVTAVNLTPASANQGNPAGQFARRNFGTGYRHQSRPRVTLTPGRYARQGLTLQHPIGSARARSRSKGQGGKGWGSARPSSSSSSWRSQSWYDNSSGWRG